MVVIGKSLKDYIYDELERLTGNILTNKEFEELKENPFVSIEEIGKSSYKPGRTWIDVHIENEERQCNIDVYV